MNLFSIHVYCLYVQVEVGSIKLNVGRIHYPTSDTANHESVLYGVIGCIVVTSILCAILVIFVMRLSMNKKLDTTLTELKQMKEEISRIVAREGSIIVLNLFSLCFSFFRGRQFFSNLFHVSMFFPLHLQENVDY